MTAMPPSLKSRALRLLSTREHSRSELQSKLRPHAQSPDALAQVLDELQAKGFINEQRVLESVLHRRAVKLGVSRIRKELLAKGLEPAAISQAVNQLRESELARAREVWRKRFGKQPLDATERAKQMRFLASRGFCGDTIRRIVSGSDDD
ncbi:recombination regulator RecX [Rhodoferax sp.]|uniref:recombination regulator RecX n=1 Tax=Rhodoferax sp. TaxID=50421 RepID=UPI002763E91D|nr:recombination regulator RecX [Rhodoferax sp.]